MTAHVRPDTIERIQLPRRLVGRRPSFRFEIGDRVCSGELVAIVADRRRTIAGREMYDVQVLGADYGRPHRTFLGDGLVAAN
ncbi:hypothetical protein [Ensifer aridi]|uniref:hypothetical protein n=1 Tax=Ensifer aridi TaxID=1708715 RepID=UPI00111C690E|nr:hypothetical protein [Ensifer aridi]